MKPISCAEAFAYAEKSLHEQGEENPVAAARFLVGGILGLSPSESVLHSEDLFDEEQAARLDDALRRRALDEPLQYIIGTAAFRYLELSVRPGVLIPRPETELLVDLVKDYLSKWQSCFVPRLTRDPKPLRTGSATQLAAVQLKQTPLTNLSGEASRSKSPSVTKYDCQGSVCRILDVGTGSGAIALALLSECEDIEVFATDISEVALEIACENARRLGMSEETGFRLRHDDLAASLVCGETNHHSFDVVVSNPPYIPSAELQKLPKEIAKYEPAIALDGGADGLDAFRRIAEQAAELLKPGGLLACELHETTLDSATQLLEQQAVWQDVRCHEDLAGCPRFITAFRKDVSI